VAKSKKVKPVTYKENFDELDDLMGEWIATQRQELGHSKVLIGGQADARHIGIYIPHLILRYLFQINVLPLGGRMMMVAGVQMSGKSSFLYWLYKLVRSCRGRGYHISNEDKDQLELRNAFLNYDEKAVDTMLSESLEDWQEYLFRMVDQEQGIGAQLRKKGMERRIPVIMGLDSLMAKSGRAFQKEMAERGHADADRQAQKDAQDVSKFMKTFPQLYAREPYMFVCTNHMKIGSDFMGRPVKNYAGGYAPKFQATFILGMQRIKSQQLSTVEGNRCQLETLKNSVGPWDKTIAADHWWYRERDTGKLITWWDWDAASIELLLGENCAADALAKQTGKRRDLLDITGIRKLSKDKVVSAVLGIEDPVSYAEAGAILEKHPEVLREVHNVLNIAEHVPFKPGYDFVDQVNQLKNSQQQAPDKETVAEQSSDD